MNRIKSSIDEVLHDVEVTSELKERTMKRIERSASKQRQYHHFQFIMKGMTLVASFTVVILLSLSYVFSGQTPESEAIKSYRLNIFPDRIHDPWLNGKMIEETTTTENVEQDEDEGEPFQP